MEQQLDQLLNLSSPVLLALVINLIVAALKKWPVVPNTILPICAMASGAVFYPMLESWTGRNFVLGIAIGGLAVALNQQLRQIIQPAAKAAALLLIPLFATGCATDKPRTQTSHVIRPAEGPDKFGRSFPQDVVTIVQPMPKRAK